MPRILLDVMDTTVKKILISIRVLQNLGRKKEPTTYNGEEGASSLTGAGKLGEPRAEE